VDVLVAGVELLITIVLVVALPRPVTVWKVDVTATVTMPVLVLMAMSVPVVYIAVTPYAANNAIVTTGLQPAKIAGELIVPPTFNRPPTPTPPATVSAPVVVLLLTVTFVIVYAPHPRELATTAAATNVEVLNDCAYPLVVA
jgi:hypothetical protein